MPPTNLAALHPDSSPLQQLYDFALQHDGEHIVINYAAGDDGITQPQLCGILCSNLITASGCAYTTGKKILFPQTHQRYLSIMTSRDGQAISGQLNPDPTMQSDPATMLLDMARSAAASTQRLNDLADIAETERQALAGAMHQGVAERNELLQRTQATETELIQAKTERDTATQQRDQLLDSVTRGERERNYLLDELRNDRIEQAREQSAMRDELSRLRQDLASSQSARQHSPPARDHGSDPLAELLALLRPTANNDTRRTLNQPSGGLTVVEAFPYVTSHGEHACQMVDTEAQRRFEESGLRPYRWLKASLPLAIRIRDALLEIDLQLCDDSRFDKWAEAKSFTFTPTQYCLYTTGSLQCRLELGAAARLGDPGIHSLLVFARQERADPNHLVDYTTGVTRLNSAPLLGSHNGVTNLHARLQRDNANRTTQAATTAAARGGRGSEGRGRGGGRRHDQLHGGGDQPPNLALLNALVRDF
jgi:hypothetical protein